MMIADLSDSINITDASFSLGMFPRKQKYDVVVVGAGPAGTSTAIHLAAKGIDTLIIERKAYPGIPVYCGEGLAKGGITMGKFKMPERAIVQKIIGRRIYSPSLHVVEYKLPEYGGRVIDRRVFDKELLAQAVEMGADALVNAQVVDLLPGDNGRRGVKVFDKTLGRTIEIEAKAIIGADGVNSIIARKSGLRQLIHPKDLDVSAQYELIGVEVDDPEFLEFHVGNDIAPRGYVRVFPKGSNRANVGLGIGAYISKKAREYLHYRMFEHELGKKKCANAKPIEYRYGAIPVGGLNERFATKNVALVGDAAGMVHPLTGGGVDASLKAGILLADHVEAFLSEGKPLESFEEAAKKKFAGFARALKVRKILDEITDEELDYLASILSGELVAEVVGGKPEGIKKFLEKISEKPELFEKFYKALRE